MTAWLAGWRAAVRIARRDAWRNKGRSSLIALMIVLPVLAGSAISVIVRSADSGDPSVNVAIQLGASVQAKVSRFSLGPPIEQDPFLRGAGSSSDDRGNITEAEFARRLAVAVPAGNQLVSSRTSYNRYVIFGDRLASVTMSELDYALLGSDGPIRQISGRAPAAAGEVVLSRSLARRANLTVGARLGYPVAPGGERTLTVVGIVQDSGGNDVELIGRAGELLRPSRVSAADLGGGQSSYYVTGRGPVSWQAVRVINQFGGGVLSRAVVANPPDDPQAYSYSAPTARAEEVATVAVVVGLILLQIALMAGPAIAVGARRNERTLGLVAASGGQARHLRAVVLAGAGLIGLVSCLLATVTGAAIGAALLPLLRDRFEVTAPMVRLHLLDLALLAGVGTVTTLLAAVLPALRVGRLDVVATLTGRRAPVAPKLRVPLTGALLVVVGAVLAWWASGNGQQFPTVFGLALAEVGLVIGSAALVGLAARAAAGAPFATRFAFRDAARQRGRTAPAVAAVLAAVAGGTTAMIFAAASAQASDRGISYPLPAGSASASNNWGISSLKELRAAEPILRSVLPSAVSAITYRARDEVGLSIDGGNEQCSRDGSCTSEVLTPTIVEPAAGRVFSTDPGVVSALAAGKVVVFDQALLRPDGTVGLTVSTYSETDPGTDTSSALPAVLGSTDQPLDAVLMPRAVADALGVPVVAEQLVVRSTSPISTGTAERANARLQQAGLEVSVSVQRSPSGSQDDSAVVMLVLVAAAAAVALIGTFTAVGLAAAEARPDLGTLAAVGAGPGLRRRLAGAQAGAIVVPAALLGTLSGMLGGWVLIRLNSGSYPAGIWHFAIPWQLGLLTVGLPVLAVAVGFATVRSRLVLVRRLGE